MQLFVLEDFARFSEKGAEILKDYINQNPGKLLCFAAGDTPLGIFRELIKLQQKGEVDLNTMFYVSLDEWAGIGYETKGSCMQVMTDNYYTPAGIDSSRLCLFNGLAEDLDAECARVRAFVAEKGGIGLTLLGIGMNGHIGFNEPGAPEDGDVLTVPLDGVTAEVGKKYFGGNACPAVGITMGLKTLRAAGQVILVANGAKKGGILRKALKEAPNAAVPASLVRNHAQLTVILDKDAFDGM